MRPQIHVRLDAERHYYFQFISSDKRLIFESTRFTTKAVCAQAIHELQTIRQLDQYIRKTEDGNAFSFIITSKKKIIIGSGKQHWGFMSRNLDIRVLLQEMTGAEIIEQYDIIEGTVQV